MTQVKTPISYNLEYEAKWTNRRRLTYLTTLACFGWITWIIVVNPAAENLLYALVSLLSATLFGYNGAATYDDHSQRNAMAQVKIAAIAAPETTPIMEVSEEQALNLMEPPVAVAVKQTASADTIPQDVGSRLYNARARG